MEEERIELSSRRRERLKVLHEVEQRRPQPMPQPVIPYGAQTPQ
jgi:hypothetical protein